MRRPNKGERLAEIRDALRLLSQGERTREAIAGAHSRADALLVAAVQALAAGTRAAGVADEVVGAWVDVPKAYA